MNRQRRGKTVEIPEIWVGQTTHKQTIRNRRSKMNAQQKRGTVGHPLKDGSWPNKEYRRKKHDMIDCDA